MNRKIIIISLICLLFAGLGLHAQEVVELNYSKAKQIALDQNKDIQNARIDVRISKHKVWETTAIGLPQVNSQVSYNNYIDIPVTLIPAQMFNPQAAEGEMMAVQFGTEHNGSMNVTASQLVFSGEYIVGLQAAKTYRFLSEQNLEKTESDVIEAVSQSYHTLLFANENLRILEKSKAEMQVTYNEMKATADAGLMEQTSVDQIMLNLRSMETAIKTLKRQINTQKMYLKIQMGMDVKDSIVITDSLTQVFDASGIEKVMLQKFDIQNNADYKLIETQVALQELNLKREKSLYLPTLAAFYQHQQTGQGNEFDFFESDKDYYEANIVGVSLDWNLFTSGGRNAKVQQHKLELEKMQNMQEMMNEQIQTSVALNRGELNNQYETYLNEKENMVLAKKIYEEALIKFKEGTISSTELTTLNNQYLNSQSSYFAAMMNVLNQKVILDNILGNN